jgi:iron complex outermembrane receptor protein
MHAWFFCGRPGAGPVLVSLAVALTALPTLAQTGTGAAVPASTPTLKPVLVTSTRTEAPPFDVPASIDVIGGDEMRDGRPQINLSESLGGIPGLVVQNRQNYAQDLQLSIRGFGARSTFGIRGVRLYVDGIPATMPDGQGQSSNIDIGSAERVEVLRGPFSALYGNSSGGVVQVFTEAGVGPPTVTGSFAIGSYGLRRYGLKVGGSTQAPGGGTGFDYLLSTSRFTTDGWRDHSRTSKDNVNVRMGVQLSDDAHLTLLLNSVRLDAQDPLGLTAAQLAGSPRSAALAAQFDTRKSVDQTQGGLVYERRIDNTSDLRLMVYYGQRDTVQFQSIPPAAQASPAQAGGVISLGRAYGGIDARWTSRFALAGMPLTLVGGVNYDTLTEQRRGFLNFTGAGAMQQLGVTGALRRDETNQVHNLDPYLQATLQLTERWTLDAGLRYSSVRFTSDDHYITTGNGNDSGAVRYRQALPVVALRYAADPALNLYATVGRGFETPTLNELSYRSDGMPGLNFALQPSTNTSVEAGAKRRIAGGMLTVALFQTRTDDEIVTATNSGGRSTFQNAGRTQRKGFELGWDSHFSGHWQAQAAYTALDATYRESFCSPLPCTLANTVPAGARIPGIARQVAQATLAWAPPQGWRAGVEARYVGQIQVNDRNTAAAAAYTTVALHAGYRVLLQSWELTTFARIDNLFDRRYAGSVIVNESNGRYFESAPGRNWSAGINAAYRF